MIGEFVCFDWKRKRIVEEISVKGNCFGKPYAIVSVLSNNNSITVCVITTEDGRGVTNFSEYLLYTKTVLFGSPFSKICVKIMSVWNIVPAEWERGGVYYNKLRTLGVMLREEEIEIAIKVVVVGNGAVGKSSMIQRYCKGIFTKDYKKTIGVDFLERQIEWVQ